MSMSAFGRLKNHKTPHFHPNFRICMPLNRHQLKIYAFSVKFNVCSKCVRSLWIKICRDFYSEKHELTQIFLRIWRVGALLQVSLYIASRKTISKVWGPNTVPRPHGFRPPLPRPFSTINGIYIFWRLAKGNLAAQLWEESSFQRRWLKSL